MSDTERYTECRNACVERMLIVEAGFLSRAKGCLREFEEIEESERKTEDYVRLSKNLFTAFTVADSMMSETLDHIRYYDEKLQSSAAVPSDGRTEENEAAPQDKAAEDTAEEGKDDTV